MSWAEASALGGALPCLEELHVCQNNFAVFDGSDARLEGGSGEGERESKTEDFVSGFEQLRVLNLAENAISSWVEVGRFARLPKLQHILLHHNALTNIAYTTSEESSVVPFACLQSLDVNDNMWVAALVVFQVKVCGGGGGGLHPCW